MGYQINLKIKQEIPSNFKSNFREKISDDEIFKQKQIFINSVMLNPPFYKDGDYEIINLYKAYQTFDMNYRMYISYIHESWCQHLAERIADKKESYDTEDEKNENGENKIWFCGWEFSKRGGNRLDLDEIKDLYFTSLYTLYTVIKTPDYFENEENFNTKLHKIKCLVEELEEQLYDYYNLDFVNYCRNNPEFAEIDEDY